MTRVVRVLIDVALGSALTIHGRTLHAEPPAESAAEQHKYSLDPKSLPPMWTSGADSLPLDQVDGGRSASEGGRSAYEKTAREVFAQAEERANIEFVMDYKMGMMGGAIAHGYLASFDLQPMEFLQRRLGIVVETGAVFYPDSPVFEVNFGLSYKHYFNSWAPYVKAYVGVNIFSGTETVNYGADAGLKYYFHPLFFVDLSAGTSEMAPFHLATGFGTTATYVGYVLASPFYLIAAIAKGSQKNE